MKLPEFDDPELKAGLQHMAGSHRASAELRRKVESLVLQSPAASRTRRLFPWMAAAAAVALLIGGGVYVAHLRHLQEEYAEHFVPNEGLLKQMVAVHTTGQIIGEKESDPDVTFTASNLAGSLSATLGRFVPDFKLGEMGWEVNQTVLCRTDHGRGAIVRLHRAGETLTFVTMPVAHYKNAHENEAYGYQVEGYPIAGVPRQGGIHCLVGDASFPLAALEKLVTH